MRFSLFTFTPSSLAAEAGEATVPLPTPVVMEMVNDSLPEGRNFYVELPSEQLNETWNETWLQLEISASQFYNGSIDYAVVTLVGIERRECLEAGNNTSTLRFPVSVSVCLCMPLYQSIYMRLCLCLCLFLYVRLPLSVSLSVCTILSVCLSLYVRPCLHALISWSVPLWRQTEQE